MDLPELAELKRYLAYDEHTGIFTWVRSTHRRGKPGDVAGCINSFGYWRIPFFGKYYMAHRLAWLFTTGHETTKCIDHINGNRRDNRIANLREASYMQNNHNATGRGARTGVKGVTINGNRFYGRVHFNYKSYNAGSFGTLGEAESAVKALREKLHKEYSKHD